MNNLISRSLVLAVAVLLSSCQKDDNVPHTDYSIKCNSELEVISQYPNGWIKEAKTIISSNSGSRTKEEFEYYQNGYIKSAKLYRVLPTDHLYMEVSRSEDNKPLWSKYYLPEGNVWFETEYENGLPLVKKFYSEEGIAIHEYDDGELISIEYTAANNISNSIITYDQAAGTRNVNILNNGQTILNENYPIQDQVGTGFYSKTFVPVADVFEDIETVYRDKNWGKSLLSSTDWKYDINSFNELIYPEPAGFRKLNTKLAVSNPMYQAIIEQYPVTENGVMLTGGYDLEAFKEFSPSFIISDSLAKVKEDEPEFFELKYGQEIIKKVDFGKNYIVIGAIRNLPTNDEAAEKIKEIARMRMDEIQGYSFTMMRDNKITFIQGEIGNGLTAEEQDLLGKVWFEVKFFSNLKQHQNGIVLNTEEDYKKAIKAVNDADFSVINLEYLLIDAY
ncbi:hypothetical protein [Pontibacter mangrovi]|uniref:Uncharacterized protein n=1 Tax=Pontibacter mangrovi TaxID=2589816 RepID=A0A501WAJ6_9BACT|nr:hypothetical protein [Pontibacter mangrovi]TPE45832.1 hypothetical protein FJM65_00340 [Pontibacter mangrovi]